MKHVNESAILAFRILDYVILLQTASFHVSFNDSAGRHAVGTNTN